LFFLRKDMSREVTWRRYLDEIVRLKSAAEKQQLYKAVGVTRTAFQRWRSGENIPDAAHILLLLNALSAEERERLQALMKEDPKVRVLLPMEDMDLEGRPSDRIPLDVYEETLRLSRDTPDRFWLLCSHILASALLQLETYPTRTGIEIAVARCMPPRQDGKIRSLREYVGKGTPPWRGDFHTKEYFIGAESLAGHAVMQHHGIMIPDCRTSVLIAPTHCMEHEMSSAAYPILREGSIAGALVVVSTIPDFFTPDRLSLIERYADLIRLAFYDQEFYPASSIDLQLMPPRTIQEPYLRSLPQRVHETYRQLMQASRALQELAQVEARVRQELEGEFLSLALPPAKIPSSS
jgi:hypothetical protein